MWHHAFEIQEILFNVFRHLEKADLVSLAITCRAFKELALDALWEELFDLSPLALCLPVDCTKCDLLYYSFYRPLTQSEWDILKSYTRRIRSLSLKGNYLFKPDSFKTLSMHPSVEPIFPNVSHLQLTGYIEDATTLSLPFPSLTFLELKVHHPPSLGNSIVSLAKNSQNITRLYIRSFVGAYPNVSGVGSSFICNWKNLQHVKCSELTLDVPDLIHLSHMPLLTRLHFEVDSKLPGYMARSGTPLILPKLCELRVCSLSLDPVAQFLPWIRLPAITGFAVAFDGCISRQDLSSFWTRVQASGIGHTLQDLTLHQPYLTDHQYPPRGEEWPAISLEDLAPCGTLSHLRSIAFNIKCTVDLTDSHVLALTSTLPALIRLSINHTWGWKTRGGITPDGLLRLLQTRPSLIDITLAIDTRDYTQIPPSPSNLGVTVPHKTRIDAVDSFLEAASVPAIAAFLAGILPRSECAFSAWGHWRMKENAHSSCVPLWEEVCDRMEDAPALRGVKVMRPGPGTGPFAHRGRVSVNRK